MKKKIEENEVNEAVENPQTEASSTDGVEAMVAELTNDLQRTRADFENFRKQVEIQKENERKMAKLATVMKILPLLDDFDRAFLNYPELKPLEKSMTKTLDELKLAKVPAEKNTEFNPDIHEAISATGEGEKEVISEVLRPGYYYEGELLRPAMVKVEKM